MIFNEFVDKQSKLTIASFSYYGIAVVPM